MKEYRAKSEHRCISRVLHRVAMCCCVLLCFHEGVPCRPSTGASLVFCSVLLCAAVCCSVCVHRRISRVLQFVTVCCGVLRRFVVCVCTGASLVSCSVLQCVCTSASLDMYAVAGHKVHRITHESAL